MMALIDKVKNPTQLIKRKEPLWEGPNGEGPNGGISFSLLSRFLVCRERFRIHTVEGLRTKDKFNHLLEFGNMWHKCEESVASEINHFGEYVGTTDMRDSLTKYCQNLTKRYPFQREDIRHWYDITLTLFPVYMDWWRKHPDMISREPLFAEQEFDVHYELPSKRFVRLRGKWDGGDIVEDSEGKSIWVQENKTKSSIDQIKIERQLSFDLQTMIYIIALAEKQDHSFWNRSNKRWRNLPIRGVRYNVVRRSAHKTPESMMKKCIEDIGAGRGSEWFARWNTKISDYDVKVFKDTCFNPILENLCHWWDHQSGACDPIEATRGIPPSHWRHPYGVYNVLDEGGSSDLDAYLRDGSTVGLEYSTNLFPELQDIKDAA